MSEQENPNKYSYVGVIAPVLLGAAGLGIKTLEQAMGADLLMGWDELIINGLLFVYGCISVVQIGLAGAEYADFDQQIRKRSLSKMMMPLLRAVGTAAGFLAQNFDYI